MNLRTIQFWKKSADTPANVESHPHECRPPADKEKPIAPADNVVPLHTPRDEDAPTHDLLGRNCAPPAPAFIRRYEGLLDAPELVTFFAENHFGLGRHNGAQYKTQEALELGKLAIVAKFQNVIERIVERNQTRLSKVQLELIAIEGVSSSMSAQLRLMEDHVRRDIGVLEAEIENARLGRGWIVEALNRYHLGFTKGLREVLEFEVLTR